MSHVLEKQSLVKIDIPVAAVIVGVIAFLFIPFYDGIEYMVSRWINKEEYSHGFFLPVIALYLLWERRVILSEQQYTGSYWGAVFAFTGLLFGLIGELATIFEAIQYGFVLAIWGECQCFL